jgi:hypothetical protein
MPNSKNSFKNLINIVIGFCLILTIFSITANAANGVNEQISFQGKLVDSSGLNVANGSYNIEFKIYQGGDGVPGGGDETLKWTETRTSTDKVTVTDGVFQVNLGSVNPFGTSIDWNQDTLWLSINIGGTGTPSWDGEMANYIRLTAVPYALNAKKVNGLTVSNTSDNPFSSATSLKINDGSTITFGGSFTTSGSNALTLTTSGTTNATLPAGTITLADTSSTQTLSNKTLSAPVISGGMSLPGSSSGTVVIQSAAAAGSWTMTLPTTGGNTNQVLVSADGAGTLGWATVATACGTCIVQVPTTTAKDTITPTANSVVALTVNGTSGTAATAQIINQSGAANGLVLNLTNTAGTQTDAFQINRNGTGGTTTNGIDITQTAGTLTNGITLGGTIGTGINFSGSNFTNLITATNFNVSNAGAISAITGISTSGGYTQSGTTANTFTGASSFTASGTGISVSHNASIGGDLGVTGNASIGGPNLFLGSTTNGTINFTADFAGNGELPAGSFNGSSGTGSLAFAPSVDVGSAGAKVELAYYNQSSWYSALEVANVSSGYSNLLLMKSGGNVGIGTGSPTAHKLQIASGNVGVDSTYGLDTNAATGTLAIGATNATNVNIGNSTSATNVTLKVGTTGNFILQRNGSAVDCSGNTNGGKLTTDSSGNIICGNDTSGAGGSTTWNSLIAPTAGLSMNMYQSVGTSFATTFTYGNATSTTNLFNITDTASNTGTGYLFNLTTASSSTLKPFHVSAAGTEALTVNASGNVGIGSTSPTTAKLVLSQTGSAITNDMLQVINTSSGLTTTTGIDGIQVDFGIGAAGSSISNAGIKVNVTSTAASAGTPTLKGIDIGDLTSPQATVNEYALNIGHSWDKAIMTDGGIANQQYIEFGAPTSSGDIIGIGAGTLNVNVTLTGTLRGMIMDLANNYISDNQSETGIEVALNNATFTATSQNQKGFVVNTAGRTLTQSTSGSSNFYGLSVGIPALVQNAGTLTAYGSYVNTGSITTGGTEYGSYINATGVGAGTLTGMAISNITAGAGTETALSIGSGWDTGFNILSGNNVIDTASSSANGLSIDIQSSSSSQYAFKVTSNNGSTTGLFIQGDGNVGIGTASPTVNKLQVASGNIGVDSTYGLDTNAAGILNVGATHATDVIIGNAGGATSLTFNVGTTGDFLFQKNNLPVDCSGYSNGGKLTTVGGVLECNNDVSGSVTSVPWSTLADPAADLSLSMSTYKTTFNWLTGTSTNNLFNLTTANSSNGTGYLLNVATGTSSTVKPFHVSAAGTEAIVVNASGRVGIGGNPGSYPFTVNTATSSTGMSVTDGTTHLSTYIGSTPRAWFGTEEAARLSFATGGGSNEDLVIDTTHRIGIGTTAPTTGKLVLTEAASASTVDLMQIVNSGTGATATSGVDGLQIDYKASGVTANGDNAGIRINATSGAPASGKSTLAGISIASLSSGNINVSENALDIGTGWDVGVNITTSAAMTGIKINSPSAAPTTDLVVFGNTSSTGSVTDGINSLQVDWYTGTNLGTTSFSSGARINVTNQANTTAGQAQALRIVAVGPGTSINSDTVGIKIDDLTGASSGTSNENAIEIGSGWDAGLSTSNTTAANSPALVIRTGTTTTSGTTGSITVRTGNSAATSGDIILDVGTGTTTGKIYIGNTSASETVFKTNIVAPTLSTNGAVAFGSIGVTTTGGRIWVRSNNTTFRFNSVSNAADYSEFIAQVEPSEQGDVMVIDPDHPETVRKSQGAYEPNILGVITVHGTGNNNCGADEDCDRTNDPRWANVGMLGQVEVKVSLENGPIEIGDRLTTSSTPGVAMKATQAGQIIGRALRAYHGEQIAGTTPKVMTLVSPSYYDPSTEQNTDISKLQTQAQNTVPYTTQIPFAKAGAAQEGSNFGKFSIQGLVNTTLNTVGKFTTAIIANLKTGSILSQEVTTDTLAANKAAFSQVAVADLHTDGLTTSSITAGSQSLLMQLSDNGKLQIQSPNGSQVVSIDANGNAAFTGTIRADKIIANQIEGLDTTTNQLKELTTRISSIEDVLAAHIASEEAMLGTPSAFNQPTVLPSGVATMSGLIVDKEATISGNLHVGGSSLIEGILNVIGSLTTRNLVVGEWSDFIGQVIFRDNVNFLGRPKFNKDTAGFSVIHTGETQVDVHFTQEYEELPVITASFNLDKLAGQSDADFDTLRRQLLNDSYTFIISNKSKTGFTIVLNKPAEQDIAFSWMVLAVIDAQTTEGSASGNASPTPTPSSAAVPSPTPTDELLQTTPSGTPRQTLTPTIINSPTPTL